MLEDGTFYSKDYLVWEQVDDFKIKNVKSMGAKPSEKPAGTQKRAPVDNAAKNKQV